MDNPAEKTKEAWWSQGMKVFAQVSGWIVGPIVIALFLGKYLDKQNNSEPWFFLGLTGIAFIISCIGIVRVAFKYINDIKKEDQILKDKQNGARND